MLACIPSARDACEHDYSVFQHPRVQSYRLNQKGLKDVDVHVARVHVRVASRRTVRAGFCVLHHFRIKIGGNWSNVGFQQDKLYNGTRAGHLCCHCRCQEPVQAELHGAIVRCNSAQPHNLSVKGRKKEHSPCMFNVKQRLHAVDNINSKIFQQLILVTDEGSSPSASLHAYEAL
jgi:hypothetical protein